MAKKTLLISEIFPPLHGGSGRWFWELYTRLPREDCVIAAGSSAESERFDLNHDLTIYRLNLSSAAWGIRSLGGIKFYWRVFRKIKEILREEDISMIHCGRCLPEGIIGYLLYKFSDTPYLCYIHGEDVEAASSSRELSWMVNRVLQNAKQLISNSSNTKRLLVNKWAVEPEKITVLNPGVDTNKFVPANQDSKIRRDLEWDDRPVILTVGRLQKRKGHDMMISAIPDIKKSFPDILYAIIGNGEEKSRLENLVTELGVEDNVQFLDEINDEQMIQCYQQCSLFILPNRNEGGDIEGFGMVLVEAQSCGKPVIAGDSGGTAETMIIGKTGEIVDCTDSAKISEKVIELLADERMLEEMGSAGRIHARESLDWTRHSKEALKLFNRLT